MNRKTYVIALLAAGVLALVLAGCGGGSDTTSSATSSGSENAGAGAASGEKEAVKAAPNAEKGTVFVSLGNASGLGMVLVDSQGMTLYDFRKDQGTESSCYNECAAFWPPLLTKGEPQPSNGADASLLGTTARKDGTTQVTYAGHPLYLFVEDKSPGEANGNNLEKFGGEWYALDSAGEEPTTSGGEGGTTTEEESASSGGYSGY